MTAIPEAKFNCRSKAFAYLNKIKISPKKAVIVLTRHGETLFNLSDRLQAWIPDQDRLSPSGKYEAGRLGSVLSLIPIKWVASSDSYRAIQTAQIAVPEHPITLHKCLRDIDYGDLRGLTFRGENNQFEQTHHELYSIWKNDRLNFAAPGGETYADFAERVAQGFSGTILPNGLGKISLVVSHVGTIREILLKTILSSDINMIRPENDGTSLTIIHFGSDGSPTLLLYNNTDHLSE